MDDLLSGIIIEGVLGIEMNVTDEFMSEMDKYLVVNTEEMKRKAEVRMCLCEGVARDGEGGREGERGGRERETEREREREREGGGGGGGRENMLQ